MHLNQSMVITLLTLELLDFNNSLKHYIEPDLLIFYKEISPEIGINSFY